MKLLRFNQQPLEIPSEIILDVDFHVENLLAVTTTENTVEYGYCLQFEKDDDTLPVNIACYRDPIREWFINPHTVDKIAAIHTALVIHFKDNKQNLCNACRFC